MRQLLKAKTIFQTPKHSFSSKIPQSTQGGFSGFTKGVAMTTFATGGLYTYMTNNQTTTSQMASKEEKQFDVIIVGAGHNGLVSANYLADAGMKVGVFERRHTVGGAAVTEEIFPGFKFSRASYLAGLLRPDIIKELNLKKYGVEFLFRDPYSFTPCHDGKRYLLLGTENTIG